MVAVGDDTFSKETLPTLREDQCYQENQKSMNSGDAQRFWSTLSIHAAAAVMNGGGGNDSALAAAESVLEHGEAIASDSALMTSQAIRNAASKASIAILKDNNEDSRAASAVAVAIIQKGTQMLQELNQQHFLDIDSQSSRTILTEIPIHSNASRKSLRSSRKSGNSSRSRKTSNTLGSRKSNVMIHNMKEIKGPKPQQNPLDDNNTIGSISTFRFKRWDKYATDEESASAKESSISQQNKVTSSVVDKYDVSSGTKLQQCSSDETSHPSLEPSQYSTDQSTIATESYHCLGKRSSLRTRDDNLNIPEYLRMAELPSSLTRAERVEFLTANEKKKIESLAANEKIESLAALGAKSSDLSSMRRKEEELERKHAEFSAAAEALEKKIAAAVAALEEAESSSKSKSMCNHAESASMDTSQMTSARIDAEKIKTPRTSNVSLYDFADLDSADIDANATVLGQKISTDAHGSNVEEPSKSKLFHISEDSVVEETNDDSAGFIDERWLNPRPSDEETAVVPFDAVASKKTLKDKVKGFIHQKKKKVTWAATNAFKTIPARSNAGIKSVSRALRRRRSRRKRSRRLGTSTSKSVSDEEYKAPTTSNKYDVKIVTFDDNAFIEIPISQTTSMFSSQNSSYTSGKSESIIPSFSNNISQFLDQAFYSQPVKSIDEETANTFSTNNSGTQSSVEAILEVDDASRAASNNSSSYRSRVSGSTAESGSNLGLRFA